MAAGRIGAYATLSRHNARELTSAARARFLAGFEAKVDPDGTLTPAERQRRAQFARREHFARLAMRSAQVRRKKAATP